MTNEEGVLATLSFQHSLFY